MRHLSLPAPGLGVLGAEPPAPPPWQDLDLQALALAGLCLVLAGVAAAARRVLAQSVAERIRGRVIDPERRARLEPVLSRIGPLATSASVFEILFGLGFFALALRATADRGAFTWGQLGLVLLVGVPLLWFVTQAVAKAVALRASETFLLRTLPILHVLRLPLAGMGRAFDAVRHGVLRLVGLENDGSATREIVAGLREVIADAEVSGGLQEAERELIGNVMEFRDVDVAAIMTPRTEIAAADIGQGVLAAAAVLAESGHSRVPVYEGTLDTIIGTISARDLVQVMATGRTDSVNLRRILHGVYFVPETKRVSELLSELRRQKIKMAIVLDEYGGTAGLVTMGDILTELVGELPDEYDEEEPAPVRRLPGGAAEVEASLHVSEVNEALDLDLPEEADYETLGGFVLAELGHFPRTGETFRRGNNEFSVVEANDRRVLKVRVKKLAQAGANGL